MLKSKGSNQLKVVLVFILLNVISLSVSAHWTASGCVSDDTGNLYTGLAYGTTFETTPVVLEPNLGKGIYCAPTYGGTCRIRTKTRCTECTTRPDENGWYYQSGKMYYYLACPIDDYIGYLLIPIAGLGFSIIRKSKLAII